MQTKMANMVEQVLGDSNKENFNERYSVTLEMAYCWFQDTDTV